MDLICFISNCFIDLLSDTSNNVCYKANKKNIIPEHAFRALQELHLDEYLPFLLTDDHNQKLTDLLKQEKKNPDGLHLSAKQFEERNPSNRESIVNQMLKRLSESQINSEGRKKKKNSSKLWMQGLTQKEIEEQQAKLFENCPLMSENATSELCGSIKGEDYLDEYKANWIKHNQAILDQEYLNWVQAHIDYNIANNVPDSITCVETFKSTYPAHDFYESQYNQFGVPVQE